MPNLGGNTCVWVSGLPCENEVQSLLLALVYDHQQQCSPLHAQMPLKSALQTPCIELPAAAIFRIWTAVPFQHGASHRPVFRLHVLEHAVRILML
jgi:hypothetical protein